MKALDLILAAFVGFIAYEFFSAKEQSGVLPPGSARAPMSGPSTGLMLETALVGGGTTVGCMVLTKGSQPYLCGVAGGLAAQSVPAINRVVSGGGSAIGSAASSVGGLVGLG